jgi:TolB-like protein
MTCVVLLWVCGSTFAQSGSPTGVAAAKAEAAPTPAGVAEDQVLRTVAVLGYEVGWVDDPKEAKQLADNMTTVVSDRLSASDNLIVVERRQIDKVMKELELNLTGLVDADKRVKAGKLLGARFLLSGSGFKMGDEIYVETKVIDAETGQIKGLVERLPKATPNDQVLMKVCEALAEKLPKKIDELAPPRKSEVSPTDAIKAKIGNRNVQWLVATREEHRGPPMPVDPAVQTELEHLLAGAGQTVKALGKDAAKAVIEGKDKIEQVGRNEQVDYIITAEGVSEFGARLNSDLVSCVGRVEMHIFDAHTGQVLASGDAEGRATDLAEQLASKQALKKATQRLLLQLVQKLPAADPKKDAAPAPAKKG